MKGKEKGIKRVEVEEGMTVMRMNMRMRRAGV